jgi:hypothetical protein
MRLARSLPLLLALPLAAAQDAEKDTLDGMNAEVQDDWLSAAEAFARAAAAAPADGRRGLRLRCARQRGIEFWKVQLDSLFKEKRPAEAARAVAIASLIDPAHPFVVAARRKVEQAGAVVPVLPQNEAACAAFPRRTARGRLRCWSTLGAPFGRAEKLIDDGVRFLVQSQETKGHWDAKRHGGDEDYQTGVTALAVLALLVDGSGGLAGDRGAAVRRAVDYLVATQEEDGAFGDIYETVFTAQALAEYATVAGEIDGLRKCLERARDCILDGQNPGAGWRYKPRGGESDTSATARAVCALHRLRTAGVEVPRRAFVDALAWVDAMTEPEYGQVGYIGRGGASARHEDMQERFPPEHTASMSGAGAFVVAADPEETRETLSRTLGLILETPPTKRYPDMYYWQIGACALVAGTGNVSSPWYAALSDAAASCAMADGGMSACDPWSPDGGRVYATAMTVLALAAPYSEPGLPGGNAGWADAFLRVGKRDVYHLGDAAATATRVYADPSLTFVATVRGAIQPWTGSPKVGADGIKHNLKSYRPLVRGEPFACLLGRVGPEGKPFRIKDGKPFTVTTPGHLYLLANDDRPEDGEGYWTVQITLVR